MSNQPYLGPGHKMCKLIWREFRQDPDFRNPSEETCSAYHRKWNSAACGAWRFSEHFPGCSSAISTNYGLVLFLVFLLFFMR
ncbi:Oidioi.mRNA.OKI2018_I69.PAR.g9471.t1.cds [Oikopleura dioica]|uniref:Oidioi.mRNA.OKI2018_I69.PAR.g9471.t1.cds n=1 Tax=Oikopleura dioica TaxID=34765 RepID=A0ABN7RTD8_OIKDI|nr:Oidioi.mRNA.OKI2018_I69.PAR.g9471.t1.cds [Oikopleura dioica]